MTDAFWLPRNGSGAKNGNGQEKPPVYNPAACTAVMVHPGYATHDSMQRPTLHGLATPEFRSDVQRLSSAELFSNAGMISNTCSVCVQPVRKGSTAKCAPAMSDRPNTRLFSL